MRRFPERKGNRKPPLPHPPEGQGRRLRASAPAGWRRGRGGPGWRVATGAAILVSTLSCPGAEPPVFVRNPQPVAVPAGHTATLTAETEFDPELAWQWRKNGRVIPGATGPHLTLWHAQERDTAEYHAVVSGTGGSRWSPSAAVIVLPPSPAPGHVDDTFTDPGLDGPVLALTEIPAGGGSPGNAGGTLLAGGDFFSHRSSAHAPRLARLGAGGMPEAAFRAGLSGPDAAVEVLAAAPDGQTVYAGGGFQRFDQVAVPGLVRLSMPGGARDPFFVPDLPAGVPDVRVLAPLPDGRLYVGGRSRTGSTVTDWLVRLRPDGSRDAGFSSPSFLNGRVRAIAVRPDGRIWLGGNFYRPAGSATHFNRIALILPDGSPDPGFRPPAGSTGGANLEVRCLQLMAEGSVTAGGVFSTMNGQARFGLAKVQADGALDSGFAPPVPDDAIQTLALDHQGRLYAGGGFSRAGTVPVRSIARLDAATGAPDPAWLPPMGNGPVNVLMPTAAGRLVAGGSFSLPHQAVVRLGLEARLLPAPPPVAGLPLTEPARLFRRTQTLATHAGPSAVPDAGQAAFPLTVASGGRIEEIRVWLDLRHADVQSLTVSLEPPATLGVPSLVLASAPALRHGADFRRTSFTAHSLRPLSQAGAPYTDALRPVSDLSVLTNLPPAGIWSLHVSDGRPDSRAATLLSWTLEILTAPELPSYSAWLAGQPPGAEAFTAFAFGGRPGQPGTGPGTGSEPLPGYSSSHPSGTPAATATLLSLNPPQLAHPAWAADPAGNFCYWHTTDLIEWKAIQPLTWKKHISPEAAIIRVQLPAPAGPRGWWRVSSLRATPP